MFFSSSDGNTYRFSHYWQHELSLHQGEQTNSNNPQLQHNATMKLYSPQQHGGLHTFSPGHITHTLINNRIAATATVLLQR